MASDPIRRLVVRRAITELLDIVPKRVLVGFWAMTVLVAVLLVAVNASDVVAASALAGAVGVGVSLFATASMRRRFDKDDRAYLAHLDEHSAEIRVVSADITITESKEFPDREMSAALESLAQKSAMKIIVSYDGTANEDDAVALGRLFGRAGAEVSLAYVRHANEPDVGRERAVLTQVPGSPEGGTALLGDAAAQLLVVIDRSTPAGLSKLAATVGASVIVFCCDSHTAKDHVSISNSAERLLEGGMTAVAIAPVAFAERLDGGIGNIVPVGDADGGAHETAQSLASALGASVAPVVGEDTDLLVIDSRADAEDGRISLGSSAWHLIETSNCPVLVLPRGVELTFGGNPAAVGRRAAKPRV